MKLEKTEQEKSLKVFQQGFNFSQDGPGNRLVVHLQGCNLKCPWCANPEGMSIDGTLLVNSDFLFDSICDKGAVQNKKINREICAKCQNKSCISYSSQCIGWSCKEIKVSDLLEYILGCKSLFFDNGGVTFSGGEPTLQFDGLLTILKLLKDKNINTAIESNGTHKDFEKLIPYLDNIILDFKNPDSNKSIEVIGCTNKIIKTNIKKAIKANKNVLIRIPLISGFNTLPTDIDGFIEFFKELNGYDFKVECLVYHEYGKEKWYKCGMQYDMPPAFVPEDRMKEILSKFKKEKIQLITT